FKLGSLAFGTQTSEDVC
ncbi:hypothetical protein DBR06_SOUSAS3410143, partial [Sousa chinensis]